MAKIGTPRAIAYLRCSTDKQADSGLGLDAQRTSVTACATRLGLPLASVLVDAGSSGSLAIEDRPVLLDAVALLKRDDVLIVAKRDRLGRDVIAVAMIERLISKRGARVVSAAGEGTDTNDPSGVLFRRLIDSFGEYERAMIAARTRSALAAKRARCERISGIIPFGYALGADGRALKAVPAEQQILAIINTRRAGGESLQKISDHLNQSGVRTRSGGCWRFEYVRSLLRKAALFGATSRTGVSLGQPFCQPEA